MNEPIEISIDFKDIPISAGKVVESPHGTRTIIFSMVALKDWINAKIPDLAPEDITINVMGSMSNCVALHVGAWTAGRGNVVFKSQTGFQRVVV